MAAEMLVRVIDVGVQTWGGDVAALRRYWRRADELGYARITYGDGLWPWTHDGWTMLGALAGATQATRIGPAVTYAFDPAAHHPSWLAKRAVSVDHLSGGRLDVRLAVGAEDAITTAWWKSHGIAYPAAPERIAILEETVAVVRRAAALDRGLGTTSVGGVGGPYRGPPRRWAAVVLMPQAEAARRARDNIAFARAHRASVTLSGVTMLVAVATLALEGVRRTSKAAGAPRRPR